VVKQCPSCGKSNRDDARFCSYCAVPLVNEVLCPSCGTVNQPEARFCHHCATPLSRPTPQTGMLQPNAILAGRYIIVRKVGGGGMGAVYQVADQRIPGKLWAIKEMSDAAITRPLDKQQAVEAFRREAQLLATLDHSNLPKVSDYFTEGGKHYLVMDFIQGRTLEDVLYSTPGSLDEEEVVGWAVQLCDALSYLHNRQPPIVFRDLKPGNVILDNDGRAKLIDFGIARLFQPGKSKDTRVMGTPGYAAPEQYGAGQTDPRSDIYALGVTLHQLLTGYEPSLSPFNLPPARNINSSLSPAIQEAVIKAIQSDVTARFQTAAEMRQALVKLSSPAVVTQARTTPRFITRHWRLFALALGVVTLSIAAIVLWFSLPPRYDSALGDLFWADDHLLEARGDWLVAISASASEPPGLVVKGRGSNIQVVGQDAIGQLWAGLAGDGLDHWQGDGWNRYILGEGKEANTLQAIAPDDRRQGVWFGTKGGVAYFDGEEWSFYTAADGLSGEDVRTITIAGNGTVWLGTWGDGLTSWGEDQVVTYRFGDNEQWNQITALQFIGEDLWIGTQAGLVQFGPSDDSVVYYTQAEGLLNDFVTALATDPAGRLWIGTWGGGVSNLDQDQIRSIGFEPRRFNYVEDLVVGGNKVWVMSPAGIMVFDLETEIWTQY
jgi:serine/threonine protein kinase